jgi:hypothetical protein
MEGYMDYNLKYYCDIFAEEIEWRDVRQKYSFCEKMKKYKDENYNLSHMLFKLCIKLHKELENRPDQSVVENKDISVSDKLDQFRELIKGFPDRYSELRHMREFDDTSNEIGNYLYSIQDNEKADEIYEEWVEAHDEIVEMFGVEVFIPDTLSLDKPRKTWIYSPQTYAKYMKNIDTIIKENGEPARLTQYKQEIEKMDEIKNLLQEN